jgi:hypothetical protein
MSNIDHMLASIIGNDKEEFSSAFANEMKERLAISIIDKNLNISQDLLADDSIDSEEVEEEVELERNESVEPLEELRGAKFFPSGYTFKTTKDAKEFVVALKHMGVKKNNISIKGKTISVNLVGGRHHDTLVMIKNLAKDMKASINEGNVIDAIREAYISEDGVIYTLKDSENIHILPEDASSIIQIHDKLNGDNQTVLRDMLSETEESYYKVLDFCNKKA